ncbi:MAG: DUF4190 domain-containing protein [Sandaracinaceae bacterium]
MDAPSPPRLRTSPLAIASLVFSLAICCFGVNGVVSVGLGLLALLRIKKRPDELTGRGLALAGIGLGASSILLTLAFIGFMVHRYEAVTPTAEAATAFIAAGQLNEASEHFTRPLRRQEEFGPELVRMRDRFTSLGTFEGLESGWSVRIQNDVTSVSYDARFSRGSARLNCSFVEEDGEYRLISYDPVFRD